MIDLLLAALIATSTPNPQDARTTVQEPETATRLEDVDVVGRPLESLIRDFVREVAAPNRDRNLSRWSGGVCVGVANLKTAAAQYIADRVSTVAEDIGLHAGRPGCAPNILVVASDQPSALVTEMIGRGRRPFQPGGSGMERGGAALHAFETSTRPVRWWSVSVPVDADNGQRAMRLPGECRNECLSTLDYAPTIRVRSASRLRTEVLDDLNRVVVVVDANQVENVTALQLADYIAMVSLAQIDPEAESARYASILNIFEDSSAAPSLTDWDLAYLEGLYSSERTAAIRGANRLEVASSIHRAHERLRAESDDDSAD